MTTSYGCDYASPSGLIRISCTEKGVSHIWFEGQKHAPAVAHSRPHPLLAAAVAWLDEYFAGERPDCGRIALDMEGTAFMKSVWCLLLRIPYGATVSYGEIARQAQSSPRAIGNAVGRNPVSLVVPCHRVLGRDGSLVGYAGGLERKEWLLRHEGAIFRQQQRRADKAS